MALGRTGLVPQTGWVTGFRQRRLQSSARGARTASMEAVTGIRRWIVLSVLCVSLLLISLDTTVLNVAMPTVVRSLKATSSQLQWMVDAYAVVFAGLLLTLGSLGDRVGRKWVFLAGLVVFAAGSAGSAFSGTPDRLVLARACMGIGAAGIMPSTLSILSNVFTEERDRSRAIGIWSGTTGLGVATGPIVGGWLLAHFWWGSVFLINVPIAVLGLIAAALLVPNSWNIAARRSDPIGALLSMLGLGGLLWGIIEAPSRTWTSPLVLGTLAGAVIVLGAFVYWERHCDHPMLRLSFFRSPRFSAAIAAMGLVLFALLGMFFLLTQWLQFSLGYSPLQTGLRVGPIALVLLVAAPLSTVLVRAVGTKAVVASGLSLIAVGLGLLSRTTVYGGYTDALPLFILIGLGTGLVLAPSIESVLGSLPRQEAGVGSATSDTALQLGGALGVAVLGTALNIRYQSRMTPLLAHEPIPGDIRRLILGSFGGALGVAQHVGGNLGAELADVARRSFVSGMDLGLVVGAAVVGVAGVVVIAVLPNRAPDHPHEDVPGPSMSSGPVAATAIHRHETHTGRAEVAPSASTAWRKANPGQSHDHAGPMPDQRRRRHRRWPWILVGVVVLVAGAGAAVIWLTPSRARPVALREAESRLGHSGTGSGGAARPAPGVYEYRGSGTESLSLPPLSQAEGPSMPGTVTLRGSNCWVFRIDYSTHHWETWEYCLRGGDLWEAGGQSWQLWSIGPFNFNNLSSFTCARSMVLPARATTSGRWMARCTGTNTAVKGATVSTGPYTFKGLATLSVGGRRIPAAHFLRLRTDSGAQHGTERSDVWFSRSTGLPLRLQQTIQVTSSTPFGTSTYRQVGVLSLVSMTPHG
ncbi:MAG TPA: MFS transporter [Acidimicrobiales bacterium]